MRKKMVRRPPVSRRRTKKKTSFLSARGRRYLIVGLGLLLIFAAGYHYRNGLAYYFSFKSDKVLKEREAKRISDLRNYTILEKHHGKAIGLDVSEFQGKVDWAVVDKVDNEYPLRFVFIRATAGNDRADRKFKYNWLGAKKHKIIRGAYHYYRPNENSLEQADLFIKTVRLEKGDLPPVLDIEKLPRDQSLDSLKVGLRRWLEKVEAHYKVKPIIYSGEKYYSDFLKEEFSDYLFWIANYNFYRETIQEDWLFWQFTEKASVLGIKGNVDVNIYNGDLEQLRFITVE